ncbi:MAG TPA: hypothetical protein VF855_10600 [Acidimicrobiales bacterium]
MRAFLRWTAVVVVLVALFAVADPANSLTTARIGWFAIAAGATASMIAVIRTRLPTDEADPFRPGPPPARPPAASLRYNQLHTELAALEAAADRGRVSGLLRTTLRDLAAWKLARHGIVLGDPNCAERARMLLGEPLWSAVVDGVPPEDPRVLADALEAL